MIDLLRLLRGPIEGDAVTCECGDETLLATATADLGGGYLCPPCAADSAVCCGLCGEDKPVVLYDESGARVDLTFGPPATYLAVCEDCDTTTTAEGETR